MVTLRVVTGIFLMLIAHCSWAQSSLSIGIKDSVRSVVLSEKRMLNVYLPEGYHESDTTKYQVIYLLDGGMEEDFIHIAGLVQFNTLPWIKRIPPSIVVGIVNKDRKRDFTFPTTIAEDKARYPTAGGSGKFIAFLERELVPYIQEKYRTSGAKVLVGQSLGGLLATEVLIENPYLFDKYVIISPSLWWDNGSLLKRQMVVAVSPPTTDIGVYIGVGKEGLAPGTVPHVMEVDANLLSEKISRLQNKRIHLEFDYLPEEDHATVTHQAVFNAFRKLYPR
ncbi:MAG TPA: alpha/beta hydrolase-fold protein [Chitinophaga sp.]|nr:alpha/beta hydrolase-fold protein [Chitinophaga sp.]